MWIGLWYLPSKWVLDNMILQEKLLMQEQGGECDQESNPTADNRRWGTVHKKKCCLSQEDKLWLGNKKKDNIV